MAFSMAWNEAAGGDSGAGAADAARLLAGFRGEFYGCLTRRADALLELADAVLCRPERVHMLAELPLEPECRRGHGAVYDAVNCGRVQVTRLRRALAAVPLPAWDDGRIRLAVDVSSWLRPDAAASPGRLFCHCYARGRGNAQLIPGWPYSVVAALEPGRTSWTLPLDAVRPGPADDATGVTAAQVREVVMRIVAAGHRADGDPDIMAVFDAGYDLTRLAWLLADLPVEVTGRLRSDRVMYFPAPATAPGTNGRPPRHGAALRFADPGTWPEPAQRTVTVTSRYGTVRATAWSRLHQKLASRAGWEDHPGPLPVIEGTLIRLHVIDHRPGYRPLEPMWLWSSRPDAGPGEVNRIWQAYLRRFDLEHTFRFFKQVLGWTRPRLRDPAAADRWTWLIITAYTQLRLARDLAADLRLPWQQPCPPGRLTPARVRRGFRSIRQALPALAAAPKPAKPGPGRPPGSKNHRPATRHDVGKTVKREEPKKTRRPKAQRLNDKLRACLETELLAVLRRRARSRTVEDVRDHPAVHALGVVLDAWRGLLGQVSAAELALATANPGWDVATVVNHAIAVTWKFSAFASGMTDRPRTPGHDFIGDDHRVAFGQVADRAMAAWRCADPHRRCYLPFGTFTADLAAGINLFDLLGHGWDIHHATGAAFSCPPAAWEAGLDAARRVIDEHRDPRHYAPEILTPPGASPQVRLLGYLGRAPGGRTGDERAGARSRGRCAGTG